MLPAPLISVTRDGWRVTRSGAQLCDLTSPITRHPSHQRPRTSRAAESPKLSHVGQHHGGLPFFKSQILNLKFQTGAVAEK